MKNENIAYELDADTGEIQKVTKSKIDLNEEIRVRTDELNDLIANQDKISNRIDEITKVLSQLSGLK